MRFSASAFYLVSLVATLVLVTTSNHFVLPKPGGRSKKIQDCQFVRASRSKHDVGIQEHIVRPDSSKTSRDLDPRTTEPLPCGNIEAGGQTETFKFPFTQTLNLLWYFGQTAGSQWVAIFEVNPGGRDRVVAEASAHKMQITGFKAVKGFQYYLILTEMSNVFMEWHFARG